MHWALIGCDAPRNWLGQGDKSGEEEGGRLNADDVEGQKQIEKGGALDANGNRRVVIGEEWLVEWGR